MVAAQADAAERSVGRGAVGRLVPIDHSGADLFAQLLLDPALRLQLEFLILDAEDCLRLWIAMRGCQIAKIRPKAPRRRATPHLTHPRSRAELLARLNLPERLWSLPPATFSGGEQQRVNIARGFITSHPVLLLDEPTASLDATNRGVVIGMIEEKKRDGVAMLGIFHDDDVRHRVADRIVDVTTFAARAAA